MKNFHNRILIVEDDQPILNILTDNFERKGYQVLTAEDGRQGLKKALTKKPDIIILDLVMPIMDGMVMLEKLRQDSWGKKAKVLILTNLESQEKINQAKELGVDSYFVKANMGLDQLVEKVEKQIKK